MTPSPTVNPTAVRLPADMLPGAFPAQPPGATRVSAGAAGAAGPVAPKDDAIMPSARVIETSAAIGELVDALKTTSIGLRFEIDETTHRVITKVIDKETGDLIRQMPTEEVLRIARAIDKLQGLFVSQAA